MDILSNIYVRVEIIIGEACSVAATRAGESIGIVRGRAFSSFTC